MKAKVLILAHLAFSLAVADAGKITPELLKTLSSEDFKQREKAQSELQEIALDGDKELLVEVLDLSRNSDDPEIRKRCLQVLRSVSDRDYLTQGKGFLGIHMLEELVELAGEDKARICVRVSHILEGSAAEESGLKRNDLIIALDGKTWHEEGDSEKFREAIAEKKPFDQVTLSVVRAGKANPMDVKVTLGKRPGDDLQGFGGDLNQFHARAREQYFEKWLKELKQAPAEK